MGTTLTYNAYLQPWQATTSMPRLELGVVRMATISGGVPGPFTTVLRGAAGAARAASVNSLTSEFLGDYNDIKTSASGAVAVWNDVRNAADCPAVDAFRQSLANGSPVAAPAPPASCPATFGNSDIFRRELLTRPPSPGAGPANPTPGDACPCIAEAGAVPEDQCGRQRSRRRPRPASVVAVRGEQQIAVSGPGRSLTASAPPRPMRPHGP
jgi:hypothetical protein